MKSSPLEAPLAIAPRAAETARGMTDEEIVAFRDAGDLQQALRALMVVHGPSVWSHCRRMLQDPTLAEDVYQQVFIEAHRDLHTFRRDAKLRTWLLSIASHRCLDAMKARRRREGRIDGSEDALERVSATTPPPQDLLDRSRQLAALEACVGLLPEDMRLAVLMRFRSGMTYQEMSATTEVKTTTLQMRVSRALVALRACIEGKGVAL